MPSPPSRPLLLAVGVAAAAAVAVAVDAFLIEPAWVQVTHHDLALPGLPPPWHGARVVHLTDLHYGNPRSRSLFEWMIRKVNEMAPDLVVITGDYVVDHAVEVKGCAHYLEQLRSRHGVIGVLGDHDYAIRAKPQRPLDGLPESLAGAGLRLLRDDGVELPGGLRVAGTDPITQRVRTGSLERALESTPNPHLFLSHSPEIMVAASKRRLPIVLSGHTHGGQVVIPFFGPPVTYTRLPRRCVSGWCSRGATRVYTCRGLSSHKSLRFCCRPEVAVFRLIDGG